MRDVDNRSVIQPNPPKFFSVLTSKPQPFPPPFPALVATTATFSSYGFDSAASVSSGRPRGYRIVSSYLDDVTSRAQFCSFAPLPAQRLKFRRLRRHQRHGENIYEKPRRPQLSRHIFCLPIISGGLCAHYRS